MTDPQPPPSARKPRYPAFRPMEKVLLVLLSGAVLAGATAVIIQKQRQATMVCGLPTPVAPAAKASALFQEAKSLIRGRQWVEAKAVLLELQSLSPETPGLQDYLAQVEQEIPNQEHLKAAEAALTEQKLALAKAELDKVNKGTRMFEQLRVLRLELDQTAAQRTREAQALLDKGEFAKAEAIAADLLAFSPEDYDATIIMVQVVANVGKPKPAKPAPTLADWEQAVSRFVQGDMAGGVALAQTCAPELAQCENGLKDMEEFRTLYKKLAVQNLPGLSRLLALDKAITGSRGPSDMGRNVRRRASNIFYKTALKAHSVKNWASAVKNSQQALAAEPGHAGASELLKQMKQQARELLPFGYSPRDEDPEAIVPKYRQIMELTTEDDELHQKAKSWVEKLER